MPSPDPLEHYVGRLVRLSFSNGEIVWARVIGVDPAEHEDLFYEVLEVVTTGDPPSAHYRPGVVYQAWLSDLVTWEPEEASSS